MTRITNARWSPMSGGDMIAVDATMKDGTEAVLIITRPEDGYRHTYAMTYRHYGAQANRIPELDLAEILTLIRADLNETDEDPVWDALRRMGEREKAA